MGLLGEKELLLQVKLFNELIVDAIRDEIHLDYPDAKTFLSFYLEIWTDIIENPDRWGKDKG